MTNETNQNEPKLNQQEWHRKQAVNNFNRTWDYIDKIDRSQEDNIAMIHTAHASRFHWGEIGTPLEFARGEWQISRVYALLGLAESALYHGQQSLTYCQNNGIGDFDLAFAYEAVARAYLIGEQSDQSEVYVQLALEAANDIQKSEDKEYFLSQMQLMQAK